jgi:hypothetical protein
MDDNQREIELLKMAIEEQRREEGGIIGDVVRAPFRIVGGLLDDLFG